ncbi:hypothetical protein [Gluconobacter aidae]|uniref:Uncharacterized protein n=1 Tax=Gluconobacter aidae TaxID=2662454 RepID=A0A7X1VPJ2_9PROT|nr:hypothetical protein [Gluconobacter aidae]MQR99881.1 hypothetical protein [Gluconobacter aidae]
MRTISEVEMGFVQGGAMNGNVITIDGVSSANIGPSPKNVLITAAMLSGLNEARIQDHHPNLTLNQYLGLDDGSGALTQRGCPLGGVKTTIGSDSFLSE